MNNIPDPNAPALDVEKCIKAAAQTILLDYGSRFPALTLDDAIRMAQITWRAQDDEMVKIGCMSTGDEYEVDGLGAVCNDCKSKAN